MTEISENEKIEVTLESFRTIKDFNGKGEFRKGIKKPGVYIWGFSLRKDSEAPTTQKEFFPYYVGKHNNDMYSRTHEHIASLAGGNCSIFDMIKIYESIDNSISKVEPISKFNIGKVQKAYQEVSKNAKKTKSAGPELKKDDKDFPNLLHFPEGVHKLHKFHTDPYIHSVIMWMLERFSITYLTADKAGPEEIADLEKLIGNTIGYENLITKGYDKPTGYDVIIKGNGNNDFILKDISDLFPKVQIKN